MESVEIKLTGIDNSEFILRYTKKIVEMLHEPELSLEMNAGPVTEDASRLLESLGYHIAVKKATDGRIRLQAVKAAK